MVSSVGLGVNGEDPAQHCISLYLMSPTISAGKNTEIISYLSLLHDPEIQNIREKKSRVERIPIIINSLD